MQWTISFNTRIKRVPRGSAATFTTRAATMKTAGELLRRHTKTYARMMAQEMGKPLAQGGSETEKCAWVCDYYAQHAERFLSPEVIATDAAKSYVTARSIMD